MRLFVEPNDVLMFRDGRPFAGGDDHFARGSFPPSPSTIYGALRSQVLSTNWSEFETFAGSDESKIPDEIKRDIGTPRYPGSLRLAQCLLAQRNGNSLEPLYPMPNDLSSVKGEEPKTIHMFKPMDLDHGILRTSLPNGLLHTWSGCRGALQQASGFLSHTEMERYLLGETPKQTIRDIEVFDIEERTGVRKGKYSRSVETGGIYSVEYFRLKEGAGFAVEVKDVAMLSSHGMLRLGGDNRSARYAEMSWPDIAVAPIKEAVAQTKRCRICLLSPAIFSNGWLPGSIDVSTMEGEISGIPVKIVGACVGRPIGIGGFDVAKRSPKVMYKAVPAGSVYFVEIKNERIDELFEKIWLKPISDGKAQEGFGISLIGGY